MVSLIFINMLLSVSFVSANRQLSVEDIYNIPGLRGETLSSIQWSSDGKELIYLRRDKGLGTFWAVNPSTGQSRLLVDLKILQKKFSSLTSLVSKERGEDHSLTGFQFAPGESRLLFLHKGDIYEYTLLGGKLQRRTVSPDHESQVRYRPDGAAITFVRNYNVFIIEQNSREEFQITRNGDKNHTYGTVDWVIKEEFQLDRGYWWSPDSRYLAILHLDESHVPEYPLIDWIPQHPEIRFQKYPKAGDPNPIPSLILFDSQKRRATTLPVGGSWDSYLPRVSWTPNSKYLVVQILNRAQKNLRLVLIAPGSEKIRTILEENDEHWINIHNLLYLFRTRDELIWGSERNGFMHLYHYKYNGNLVSRLTDGPWNVTDINQVNEWGETIYFTATAKSPQERHLYIKSFNNESMVQLTQTQGTHKVRISPDVQFFMDQFTSTDTPPVYSAGLMSDMQNTHVFQKTDESIFEPFKFRRLENVTLQTPDETSLYARMLKPDNFDPNKKYPVIIYVYGGPHAQVVVHDWSATYYLWHQLMAQKGFIIFSLDNRGSGGRGKKWERAIYHKLGEQELSDQMIGVHYLRSLPYVDSQRIGIWGWSYGGTMTCLALTKQPDFFRAGAAVAPVVDWLNYDSIYTERYMGLPKNNEEGYRNSSPVHFVENLKSPLLLIHGTSDDNVHFQNAIQIFDALIKHNKQFQSICYPRMTHGIRDRKSRIHLFNLLTDFFEKQLKN